LLHIHSNKSYSLKRKISSINIDKLFL